MDDQQKLEATLLLLRMGTQGWCKLEPPACQLVLDYIDQLRTQLATADENVAALVRANERLKAARVALTDGERNG